MTYLKHKEIVVGSSFDAVKYAFVNELPIFYSSPQQRPFKFDFHPLWESVESLSIPNERNVFYSPDGYMAFNGKKEITWERMLFYLSLLGKVPLSEFAKSLRIEDNRLFAYNEYYKIAEIEFEKCYFFGDSNINDILEIKEDSGEYIVYDWLIFSKGGTHDIDFIDNRDEKYINFTWFYRAERSVKPTKDCCCVSYLKKDELDSEEYETYMIKYKLSELLKSRGHKGAFKGYSKKGVPYYNKFIIKHTRRDIIKKKPVFFDKEQIIVPTNIPTWEDVCKKTEDYKLYINPGIFYEKSISEKARFRRNTDIKHG